MGTLKLPLKMSGNFKHNGLILLSGVDEPGIMQNLFGVLEPFNIQILDIEQVVIRDRLILTVQIAFDPSHASAIENDLVQHFNSSKLDIAVDFSTNQSEKFDSNIFSLVLLSSSIDPKSIVRIATIISKFQGNIENVQRTASAPITALEFKFSLSEDRNLSNLKRELADVAYSNNFDIAIQEETLVRRAKRIVLLDMDSTLIQEEVIDLLAAKVGCGTEVAEITERAMRGELDFAASLRARVKLLKGASQSILQEVAAQINLTPGARTLIATLHKLGHKVGVVSGGFLDVIEPLLKELKIDFYRANRLQIENGVLTGNLQGDIIDRQAKGEALKEFAQMENVDLRQSIAIGDGANDLYMIELAGLGIAFNAKPAVRAAADAAITNPYLDSVLYLLGISRSEVEALTN